MGIADLVARGNLSEFVVWSLVEGRLTIFGSDDMAYYHQLEVVYEDVTYIETPTSLWMPAFREATEEERLKCRWRDDDGGKLYVIEDRKGDETLVYYVAAASCSERVGMVYHYDRTDLRPGEQIAPWVRRQLG